MKQKRTIFPKSIFFRLIFTFLIILLPIFILSVGIHQWGVAIIRAEIMSSMKSQMDYHKTILDNELNRIQYLQYDALSDQDLQELSNFPQGVFDFDKVQSMNRLQNRLSTFKNSSIYIEDVKAIIPLLKKTISADNGVLDISKKDLEIINSFSGNISKLNNENNVLFSRVRNNSINNKKVKPHYVIQVQFSNSKLKNTFMNFNVYKGSGSLIYGSDVDYILATYNDSSIIKKIKELITNYKGSNLSFNKSVSFGNDKYLLFCSKLNYNNMWLSAYVPEKQVYSPLNKYLYLLWIFAVISIFIIGVFSFSTHKLLQRPLKKLVSAFHRVEAGELKFDIKHNNNDEFQYLYTRFNAMLDYINNLIDQVYTQKIMSQKAELKQLQSQINPHFLFNSFFILQRMIQGEDIENATKFCSFLGQYFQYVTRNSIEEMPLYKEVEHARNYLEIQVIRFSNTYIEFEELPLKYRDILVPRLILQPIIENAFEHGFNKNVKQRIISVRFTEVMNGFYIIVEDNGSNIDDVNLYELNQSLSEEASHDVESTGLINISKRIRLKFGGRSGVTVSHGELGGFKAVSFFEIKEDHNV